MNPVAFEIFGLQIRWYGIIIASGVMLAFLLSSVLAKKKGLSFDDIVDAFIWAFPLAIVGARAYYVIFEFKNFDSFADMINIRTGGLAIHGGLIVGILTAYIVMRVKKLNFLEYIDVVIPSIVLAQGIGRWGNFMNQEAHGGAVSTEFISKFPQFIQKGMLINGAYYHPTFLYESICDVLICLILVYILFKKKNQHGIVLGSYLILYSTARFFIEGLRTDSLMFVGLRVAQLISIIGIILGIGLILLAIRRAKR